VDGGVAEPDGGERQFRGAAVWWAGSVVGRQRGGTGWPVSGGGAARPVSGGAAVWWAGSVVGRQCGGPAVWWAGSVVGRQCGGPAVRWECVNCGTKSALSTEFVPQLSRQGLRDPYAVSMIRFLVRAAIFLASSAIGLLVAKVTLDGMSIDATSFVAVVVIFAVLQSVLAPFLAKITMRNAPALLGATGLISTFVALLVTDLVSDGFTITGIDTWVFATLIVWITTMLATLLLPIILVKMGIENARERRSS